MSPTKNHDLKFDLDSELFARIELNNLYHKNQSVDGIFNYIESEKEYISLNEIIRRKIENETIKYTKFIYK